MEKREIDWPSQFAPAQSAVHIRNTGHVESDATTIWSKLIDAERWPDWYANAHDVRIVDAPRLNMGVRFTWKTFGVSLVSRVEEFVPESRIAWSAIGYGIAAYHAWLIQPDGGGSYVLTEETQTGLVARLGRIVFPGRMERWHQVWLETL